VLTITAVAKTNIINTIWTNNLISFVKLCKFTHLVFLEASWNLTNLHCLKINDSTKKSEHSLRYDLMTYDNNKHVLPDIVVSSQHKSFNRKHYTNDAWWSVRQSNMICPEVKMSTRGQSPSVDILTEGHIILECCTMNIMHHMFCHMTNCDKKIIGEWK